MWSDIWGFITGNLPSPGAIFYSSVLGAITIVVLALWRRLIDRASKRFISDEKIDGIITRFERNGIIKIHNHEEHEKALKHCAEGHCAKLATKRTDPMNVVLAAESGLDLHR